MRNYGRFTTTIWRDPDFTSLTQQLQAVYFMLGTQPDISAAGLLAMTTGRWAKLSADVTKGELEKQIRALADHPAAHLVVDEDTEEVLVRKFIKFDEGWKNSKRMPVVIDAIHAVTSPQIRDAAVDELLRLAPSVAASLGTLTRRNIPPGTASDTPSDAITGFDRLRVNSGEYRDPSPFTLHREGPETGYPIPDTADASAGPPSMFCSKHPEGTEQPCGPCGTARDRYRLHVAATLEAEAEAKRAAAQARAACPLCDNNGKRLHPDTKLPLGRCNHQPEHDGAPS